MEDIEITEAAKTLWDAGFALIATDRGLEGEEEAKVTYANQVRPLSRPSFTPQRVRLPPAPKSEGQITNSAYSRTKARGIRLRLSRSVGCHSPSRCSLPAGCAGCARKDLGGAGQLPGLRFP